MSLKALLLRKSESKTQYIKHRFPTPFFITSLYLKHCCTRLNPRGCCITACEMVFCCRVGDNGAVCVGAAVVVVDVGVRGRGEEASFVGDDAGDELAEESAESDACASLLLLPHRLRKPADLASTAPIACLDSTTPAARVFDGETFVFGDAAKTAAFAARGDLHGLLRKHGFFTGDLLPPFSAFVALPLATGRDAESFSAISCWQTSRARRRSPDSVATLAAQNCSMASSSRGSPLSAV